MHPADGTKARDAPAGKLRCQFALPVSLGGQTDGRNLAVNQFGVMQDVVETSGWLHVGESIQAGKLEPRISFVNDGPRSRAFTGPELRFGGRCGGF